MDIKAIVDNNAEYVTRCIAYRDNLTSEHSAKMLVDIFKKNRK